jgi:hypothetical protein
MGREEHGNISTGIDALRQALRRGAEPQFVESSGMANTTPERVVFPLTSEVSFRPRVEPTFLREKSPPTTATNFRVATREEKTPISRSVGENGEGQVFQADVERSMGSGNYLPDPAFDDLIHRRKMAGKSPGDEERRGRGKNRESSAGNFRYMPSTQTQGSSAEVANQGDKDLGDRLQEVAEFYAGLYPNSDDPSRRDDIREIGFANNSHHLTSFQTQVSPVGLPERFRAGRESLSVVRNVTIRDPKRTKNRARDEDYKRWPFFRSSPWP